MNEEVMLSCPAGFQPSFTHVKCAREVQSISHGKPVYREVWFGGDSGGDWTRIQSSVECIGKGGIRSSPGCPALPFLSRGRQAVCAQEVWGSLPAWGKGRCC